MKQHRVCTLLAVVIGLVAVGCQGQMEVDSGSAAGDPAATPTDEATEAPQLTGDLLVDALNDPNIFLLDVRRPEELEELGTVEGYTNIPIDELAGRLEELPRDRPILTA